jgi:Protein of unknown function (DUF2462)
MAQGAVKKSAKASASYNKSKHANAPKRGGNRVIKPKKASLISKQKLLKKHTSGLTALTESTLSAKAGHLEILGGGKKAKKSGDGKDGKKKG